MSKYFRNAAYVFFAGLPFLAGCSENVEGPAKASPRVQASPKVQIELKEEGMTEETLDTIVQNLRTELQREEFVGDEFQYAEKMVFRELVNQGIIKVEEGQSYREAYFNNIVRVMDFKKELDKQLPTQSYFGLIYDYTTIDGSALSLEAQDDVKAFEMLRNQFGEYCKKKVKNGIASSEFEGIIEDFVNANTEMTDDFRKMVIAGRIYVFYEHEFEVKMPKARLEFELPKPEYLPEGYEPERMDV